MNHNQWPEVTTKDVEDKSNELVNALNEIQGNSTNETILSLPVNMIEILQIHQELEKYN